MVHALMLVGWVSLFAQPAAAQAPAEAAEAPAAVAPAPPADLLRGVAFDQWLTGQVPHGDTEVGHVASLGANCIKLLVPFGALELEAGGLREDALARLDRMVGMCRVRGLEVILACSEPAETKRFAADRAFRQRFVDTWVALAQRYAAEPTVVALIPLERPAECLTDAKMYGDLCSYLSTQVYAVNPLPRIFLAPLASGSPADAPLLSYERVGALCRPATEATVEERTRTISAARAWSVEKKRPVLMDRIAAPPGLEPAVRNELVNASFTAANEPEAPLSWVYETYRVRGPADGAALSFEGEGRFLADADLAGLLTTAFAGGPGAGLTPPGAPPEAPQ